MHTTDLDPKGYLPLLRPLFARLLSRLGVEPAARTSNVTCCA